MATIFSESFNQPISVKESREDVLQAMREAKVRSRPSHPMMSHVPIPPHSSFIILNYMRRFTGGDLVAGQIEVDAYDISAVSDDVMPIYDPASQRRGE